MDRDDFITLVLVGINITYMIVSCLAQVWVNNGIDLTPLAVTLIVGLIFAFVLSLLVLILVERSARARGTG